jgi:hypothetical protein
VLITPPSINCATRACQRSPSAGSTSPTGDAGVAGGAGESGDADGAVNSARTGGDVFTTIAGGAAARSG